MRLRKMSPANDALQEMVVWQPAWSFVKLIIGISQALDFLH
jgi:hypothetical protein